MIYKAITWEYEFTNWVKNSDSYSRNFTFEGANAVQAWYEEISTDIGENIEFDPIAWCCEWSEYDSLAEAYKEYRFDYSYVEGEAREYFEDNTSIIELDNGVVIVHEF